MPKALIDSEIFKERELVEFDKDFNLLARHMGYRGTSGKETAMIYTYRPSDIGLTSEIIEKKKALEQVLFSKDQKSLNDY